MSLYQQLALPLRFDQSCSFEHYYGDNDFASHSLKRHIDLTSEPLIFVTGEASTGKSHLLNASALYCQLKNIPFQYFSGQMLLEYGIEIIAECNKDSVLIIDDVHHLAGNRVWERKLYDLYNDAQRHHWLIILSALKTEINRFLLKDWASRIKAGVQISLVTANETELKKIIQFRSKLLGLKIRPEVIDYLLVHFQRELSAQIGLLKKLDERALEQHRNITIPFVKEVLLV